MYIVQHAGRPGEIQNALFDLMREGVSRVRVCCAYVSLSGSQILYDGIVRSAAGGDDEPLRKTLVTSLDFGLTDPDALAFWRALPGCRVLVAGSSGLDRGSLIPAAAFHPKIYLFDRPDGTSGSLVGSANLTNRGLTVNGEVAWLQIRNRARHNLNQTWRAAIEPAVPLTEQMLERYRALRGRAVHAEPVAEELAPVPAPRIEEPRRYAPFAEAEIEPADYDRMWIQSRGMQGGAGTQLELPRGTHRFFGAAYADYEFERVEHIAEPVLVSGRRAWNNRPLTWHGDNAMERINLPSQAMGGFRYENAVILFRRVEPNTFELRVHSWDSDQARAYVEASRQAGLLFRVGRNSNRLAGFLT